MAVIAQDANLISTVLERLTDTNLQASRVAHPTAFDGQFYAAFGIDGASIGDNAGFERLKSLAHELTTDPAVALRIEDLRSKGISVEFTVYDEPAGHSLCILIKDRAIYDEAYKKFALEVARNRSFLSWVLARIRAKFFT